MPMKYYRTSDGLADYKFSFEEDSSGDWRPYILSQPSYRGRATDCHSTHRLTGTGSRKYVCWTRTLATQADAERVAAMWADKTQEYIRNNTAFG